MILECILVGLVASLLGSLLITAARNHQRHQFFKKRSPDLLVADNPSLFGGHAMLCHGKYNTLLAEEYIKKLGPTFGFYYGIKPAAITIDLEFIKAFAIDQQDHINRFVPDVPFAEVENDCIVTAYDEQWMRIRRAVGPAFSAHRVKSLDVRAGIDRIIEKFVDSIERHLTEAQTKRNENFIIEDMDDICHRFSLALVFSCFYKQHDVIDFYSIKDKQVDMIKTGLKNLVNIFLKTCVAFPSVKPIVNWLVLNFDQQGVMRNTIMRYIKQQTRQHFEAMRQIKARLEEEKIHLNASQQQDEQQQQQQQQFDANNFTLKDGSKFRRNMVDYIIDQYREGKLTKSEFFNSTFFLFFAADKSASDAISKCLYNLACNQSVQQKLRDSILADGVDSEYLGWVIFESLRLFPTVPLGVSRTLKRDMHTKHGMVPEGTFVITPAYTINRLPEYWGQDANEFKPERWANSKSFHPCQYLSFGLGRRSCVGKDLVLLEIKMLLNVLMRKYKFERCAQTDDKQLFDSPLYIFLVFDEPTYLKISRL